MNIESTFFGTTPGNEHITLFTIRNDEGGGFSAINYGAILVSFILSDREGKLQNLVLGFDTFEAYLDNPHYFGATIGRMANRIAGGTFVLNRERYQLDCNEQFFVQDRAVRNHEHGGLKGFHSVVWEAKPFETTESAGVCFTHFSPNGSSGYPGDLQVQVTLDLNIKNELSFEYSAECNRATPLNMTNHAYWNLEGAGSGSIRDHELQLHCPFYLPIDATMIPTGEIRSVEGTPMDFRTGKPIGRDLDHLPIGYDHCFVAEENNSDEGLKVLAKVFAPRSGRVMEVLSTKPAVQFYTGNHLEGVQGAGGAWYGRHGGFCLETQFYPDAVNQPHFPSVILLPGRRYQHKTVHRYTAVRL